MPLALSKYALVAGLSACLAGSAAAGEGIAWGTRSALPSQRIAAEPLAVTISGRLNNTIRYTAASFGTGAVGLRNRGEGGIEVSGVVTPIKRALVYWAVVTQGAPTSAVNRIDIKRGSVGATFTTIVGAAVGTGASPCWGGDRTTVYRGNIPLTVATGNGVYIVRLKPGGNGSIAGGSPWASPLPPLPYFEGASIVIVGSGSATVGIYDTGLAGKTFYDGLIYSLNAPASVASATQVLFHNIAADGQIGVERIAYAETSNEFTTLNNRRIAGPGSPATDSDWNGEIAGPLPQLWDNTTHDVTAAAKVAGSLPTVLPFVVNGGDDCVVPVANVVSVRN